MSEDINLGLISNSFKRVAKRELSEEELKEFCSECLKYESKLLFIRTELHKKGELKESEINTFDFYNDGFRSGVLIELIPDNMYPVSTKDGKPVFAKQLFKKDKDGNYVEDDSGNKVATERVLMRIKSRRGGMGLFIGKSKFEVLDSGKYYILVGGLTIQYKNNTTNKYVSEKQMAKDLEYCKENNMIPDDYSEYPTFTLNVFQIAEIKQSGKKIELILPDCNWKKENGDDE